MKILGISISHDAGAAVIKDGKILSAVNEERFNREKLFWGLPRVSIKEALRISDTEPKDIDYVAIAGITPSAGPSAIRTGDYRIVSWKKKLAYNILRGSIASKDITKNMLRLVFKKTRVGNKIRAYLSSLGIEAPIRFIEHHLAHAASAYYTSPYKKDCLAITTDGAGDFVCSVVCTTENNELVRQADTSFYHSPARIYSYVTYNMGFRPGRHEGKITGLAAYGNAEKTWPIFRNMVGIDSRRLRYKLNLGCWGTKAALKMHNLTWGYKREDIAAGVQRMVESVAKKIAEAAVKMYGNENIVLAGGLFANVKVNQRISEIPGVRSVYIHPHMGDGGLAMGSALKLWADLMVEKGKKPKPNPIDNVYFGPEFSDDYIEKSLQKAGLKYKYHGDVESEVAQLVADKKVVGRFNGRMEYGPRALGNRSILADPTDKTINDWLNKRLHRCYDEKTEIMTSKGWKFMKDVGDNEIVVTLNAKENKLEFQKILSKTSYYYDGKMYKIKNRRINLLVTPNHRMWIKRKHANKFEFKKIDDVFKIKTYHYEKKSGTNWKGKEKRFFILPEVKSKSKKFHSIKISMDIWLKFFGFWLSEGSHYFDGLSYGRGHYRVTVAQSKKSKYFNEIQKCLNELINIAHFYYPVKYDRKEFLIYSKQLYAYLSQFGKAKNKFIPRELLELSKRQLQILFDALMKGDGNIRGKGFRYATTSNRLADDIQELSLKLGLSAYISIQKGKKKAHNDLYMVRIGRSSVTTIRREQISKIDYIGKVHCVSVPNRIIFVRRNGKTVFCGNTEFMPFAPVILRRDVNEYYERFGPGEMAAQFMTITFDVKEKGIEMAPAVCHIDNTARPQTITREQNKSYYKILKIYKELTGLPLFVNISFNIHEQPIVCTPEDAIKSFKAGSVDVLAIGNFLAWPKT